MLGFSKNSEGATAQVAVIRTQPLSAARNSCKVGKMADITCVQHVLLPNLTKQHYRIRDTF